MLTYVKKLILQNFFLNIKMSTNINHYGPLAVLTIMGFTMGYQLYKEFNPTIDDLKKRKELREQEGINNVLIGINASNHLQWEEECIQAGKIL